MMILSLWWISKYGFLLSVLNEFFFVSHCIKLRITTLLTSFSYKLSQDEFEHMPLLNYSVGIDLTPLVAPACFLARFLNLKLGLLVDLKSVLKARYTDKRSYFLIFCWVHTWRECSIAVFVDSWVSKIDLKDKESNKANSKSVWIIDTRKLSMKLNNSNKSPG